MLDLVSIGSISELRFGILFAWESRSVLEVVGHDENERAA